MQNKKILWLLTVVIMLSSLALPMITLAAGEGQPGPYLGLEYGAATGLGKQDIRLTIANIISAALGLLGIIAVVIIIYAGFRWMTAGGNEESVKSAQKILSAAVIGLVIILSAYAISKFVMTQLFHATTGNEYSTVIEDNP